ncbi:hypothetical protein JL101_020445 [Skermanella rosea]|uniref:hypothetical protein n=1 Tax=Skermanella rosea TaxID=1817965 RepID=UPI001931AF78|nr:hypothetical protein [Skermanella rosea]UEM02353.1 hypothetical protein JL101_020445 [Skermanella rosea]
MRPLPADIANGILWVRAFDEARRRFRQALGRALLDRGLMIITPDLRAVFALRALGHYREFGGKPLRMPARRRDWPQP